MNTGDLFAGAATHSGATESLGPGAAVLRGFALAWESEVMDALGEIVTQAPFRYQVTPGGRTMSVGMTNAGPLGWVSDRRGYRYDRLDPVSGKPWPNLPNAFMQLATEAAETAGFEHFIPDACLINRYEPGARLSLHQDRDERDMAEPIVSVSLGIPAVFQFGGLQRSDKVQRVPLGHGDVVAWGGPARLRYHGILPVKPNSHDVLGSCRINLTFRRAG